MRVKKVEVLGNRDGTCGASKRGKIVSGIGHAYAVQGAGKKISNYSIPDRISGKTIRRCLQAMDESCVVSARSLKRPSPFWSSNVEVPNRKVRKVSEIGREGDISQIRSGHSSFRWKMVDEVAIPQYLLEELHMPGMNQTLDRYSDRVMEERYLLMRERNCGTNGSDIASVGSCSVSDSPRRPSKHISVSKKACVDTRSSDAESFCCREDDEEEECSHSLGEDVATRIHRLELQAYRCTLEALYTSGPLSWEREALLTNLRMSLHVSNDEHLLELRNLVSAKRTL